MSIHNFIFNGKPKKVYLEKYKNIKKNEVVAFENLKNEVKSLLNNCWGIFPDDFIEKHILSADNLIIARVENECVGLCAMSLYNLLNLKIHYIEFLLVNKSFQRSGLGLFLSFRMMRDEIVKNILSIFLGKPLEVFFITPNIRVLSSTAKIASFIYPNPYLSDHFGRIPMADDETWNIARELLKRSDNPNRELLREGLVLKSSYASMPWLIYNNDSAPWDKNEKINVFARNYLNYHKGEDREFMVRAHINLLSIIKYIIK